MVYAHGYGYGGASLAITCSRMLDLVAPVSGGKGGGANGVVNVLHLFPGVLNRLDGAENGM